jgi:hypothetical protein
MKKIAIWVVLLALGYYSGQAQCGEETYELALAQAGKDVVLVRDFKVRLKEGNKRNPIPSSRFSVLMQKGLTYRFTLSKDKYSIVEPVLQLFDRNELLGSTYKQGKDYDKFEYICARTGNYQVLISVLEGKAGCAIGLMSMVIDSAFYAQGNKVPQDDRYLLYAGIENPLSIITDQKDIKSKVISIDRGQIIEKDSNYYSLIPSLGPVNIHIKLINYADTMVEELNQEFIVVPIPAPTFKLEDSEREWITRSTMSNMIKLLVSPQLYKIEEFYISTDLGYNTGLRSTNEYLTYEMIEFIKDLGSEQRFYIKEIKVLTPKGTVEEYGPLRYYVQ